MVISGGFALLQLQRGQIVVAADELSTAADWQVKAYHSLKLLLPLYCSQVVPETLDYIMHSYYTDPALVGHALFLWPCCLPGTQCRTVVVGQQHMHVVFDQSLLMHHHLACCCCLRHRLAATKGRPQVSTLCRTALRDTAYSASHGRSFNVPLTKALTCVVPAVCCMLLRWFALVRFAG
jgi:hypothetical protein